MAKKFGIVDWSTMTKQLDDEMKKGSADKKSKFDERFYYPDFPSNGVFKGKIRFLPSKDFKSLPVVKKMKHSFNENGKWFTEPCLKMFGKKCPVCNEVFKEWNKRVDEGGKDYAKKYCVPKFTKEEVITNILVIDDPVHPENNGKVFLYRLPKSILEIIENLRMVDEDDPKKNIVYVQDYYDGATFKFDTYKNGEFIQYDKCKFLTPEALYDGDEEKIEQVHQQVFDLEEFVSEKSDIDTEAILTKYRSVCGIGVGDSDQKQESDKEVVNDINRKVNQMIDEEKQDRKKVVVDDKTIEDSVVDEDDVDDFVKMMDDSSSDLPF